MIFRCYQKTGHACLYYWEHYVLKGIIVSSKKIGKICHIFMYKLDKIRAYEFSLLYWAKISGCWYILSSNILAIGDGRSSIFLFKFQAIEKITHGFLLESNRDSILIWGYNHLTKTNTKCYEETNMYNWMCEIKLKKRIGDKHHQKTLTAVVPSWSVLNLAQSTCKVTRKKHDEIKCIQNWSCAK
jgi:hypothetical protein